jgi:uncharacterized protein YndB with AHSA1/START domain
MKTTEKQAVIHNTFVIERSFPAPPERVFEALADPAKKRRWYGEGNTHEIEEFEMDFRVGGVERNTYRFKGGPFDGVLLSNDGSYQDIVPNERVIVASTMTMAGRHISVTLATFELVATDKGTDLIFTHQGAFFEGSGGPEMRVEGWNTLFGRMEKELGH